MKKRKPILGKFCQWPVREAGSVPCNKPAYVHMTYGDGPGRWCCGIHENAGWSQGWEESADPDYEETDTHV
jgi:hypothetical protein